VVEDADVPGPGPAPLVRDPVLFALRLLARRLIYAVLVDAAVDPGPAARRAVVLELLVGGERFALRACAIDLSEHRFGVGLLVGAFQRVVPGQLQDWTIARIVGVAELLADCLAQVVDPVQLRAA